MADEIVYTANASQAFDVIARLQAQVAGLDAKLNSTGRGGDHIGEGFLRSERIVSRSAANMAQSLLTINDPLTAISQGLLQFEHATKLGLGLAVGLAVGVVAFETLHKQIEETKKVEEEFRKVTERPLTLQLGLSAADLGKEIADQEKQNAALQERRNSIGNLAGIIANRSTRDPANAVSSKLENQDQELLTGSNKLIELIKAQAGAEANLVTIKAEGIRGSEEDAAITKAELDYTEKVAALRKAAVDNPNLYAGLQVRLDAARQEKEITEDLIRKKSSLSQVDLLGAEQQADFRGTPQERKDFTLQNNLESAEAKKAIVDAQGNEQDKAQAVLEISKAQLAIDENQVEKRKQAIDLASNLQEANVKAGFARAGVGLGSEGRAALGQDESVELAGLKVQKARELLAIDSTDVGLQKQLTSALGEQAVALANKAKFQNDKSFKDAQELKGAKAATEEASLQSQGQNFQATILKLREAAEQKILSLLRDQKGELAGQAAQAAKIGITKDLGDRLAETPAEQNAREAREREQQRRTNNAEAAINDAADREARGARLDENNPVTQALRAQQSIDQGLAPNGQGNQDFSSVASLAGQDFSSLASLGNLDFSGIQSLANLNISIA